MCKLRNIFCILMCCLLLSALLGCNTMGEDTTQKGPQQSTSPTTVPPTENIAYDSLNIPEAEVSLVRDNPDEIIVRVFLVSKNTCLDGYAIEEIVADGNIWCYAVFEPLEENSTLLHMKRKRIVDGTVEEDNPFGIRTAWQVFMEYAIEPHNFLDSDVKVDHVYCLQLSHFFLFAPLIYYSTDQGDFVLFYDYYSGHKMYLFPAEVYYSIDKKMHDTDVTFEPGTGGILFGPWMVWDIEPYRIELPEDFLLRV